MRYSVSTHDFERGVFDPQVGCWWMRQNLVAFTGLCQVRAERDQFFGGEDSRPFRSKVLLNPTWRQLFAIAKKQQEATKDVHHDFFEGYRDTGRDDMMVHPNHLPVRVIELALGS
jgi:hypothetical protein